MTSDPSHAARQEPKRTIIAGAPPPPGTSGVHRGPVPPVAAVPAAPAQAPQGARAERAGSHLTGYEGLHEPGSEVPRIRLLAGKMVPGTRYKIIRWLGEGGMGVVYEAEHVDIERRVAMKILRFDLSQQSNIAQVFRDEARAASRIGSSNIVEIYDFGELKDGRLFFCMELLAGKDLVPESEDTARDPGEVIGILRQLCKGLHAAHSVKIVHRDIKPENVLLVERNGRSGIVKIVDFGISAMLAAGDKAAIAGTPQYMAPEQIMGEPFDGRLDMYALGSMAYELLTGRTPFTDEDLDTLLRNQVQEPPPRFEQVRPDRQIPPALAAVIYRCLEKSPQARYRDMADLEAALCEAQVAAKLTTPWDDLPLPEVEPDRRERLLREMPTPLGEFVPVERRRWVWPAVAGLAVLLAVGAVAVALRPVPPTQEQVDTIEQLSNEARAAAALSRYVYPPFDDREAPTAYRKVLALENLDGSARRPGVARGTELRSQFSQTLVALGDRFWDDAATRRFAREYYVQALMFDESLALPRERAGITPGALADLRELAANGSFTAEQLAAAEYITVFADEDVSSAQAKLDSLGQANGDALDLVGRDALAAAAKRRGIALKQPGPASVGGSDATPEVVEDPPPVVEDPPPVAEGGTTGDEGDDPSGGTGKTGGGGSKSHNKKGDDELTQAKRDPARAAELAAEGNTALRAGRRSEAAGLFNQALALDSRCAPALMGLSDIEFDTGSDQKAVNFAERAVKASPKNAGYRLSLGDAYFKVLQYADAKAQYEEAKKLGSSKADERIAKVNKKLGG